MKKTIKLISTILSIFLILSFMPCNLVVFAATLGTEQNPYEISTATQLKAINNNLSACYKLTANIDLNGEDFTPLGNAESGTFSGIFDGNGFTISNLNVFSGKFAGLFGCNEGTIKNVKLSGIYVYGTRYIGGVVGQNTTLGSVFNCSVSSGDIEADDGINEIYAGGIIGYNEGFVEGTFSNNANLKINNESSSAVAGGIIGKNNSVYSVNITDSTNTGNISASGSKNTYCGGLVGINTSAVEITNSTNTGNVSYSYTTSYSYSGGFVGYNDNGAITITNSTNTGNVSSSYTDPYSYFGGFVGYNSGYLTITDCTNSGNVLSSYDYYSYSGGFVGYNSGDLTITNSTNTGNVSYSYSYSQRSCSYSGGFVGYNSGDLTITDCTNSGNVLSSYDYYSYSGGFVGYNSGDLTITNSTNTGNVSSPGSGSGGFVGYNDNGAITITNGTNTGNVSSSSSSASYSGGFVGSNKGTLTITDCTNTGNISSSSSDSYSDSVSYSGGFVGVDYEGTITISNSTNTGNISGSSGGFVGSYSYNSKRTIIDSYCLTGSVGRNGNYGYNGYMLTPEQMRNQNSFNDFDFENVWTMNSFINEGYPYLKNTENNLQLNICSKVVKKGDTLQLKAYRNGIEVKDITWSVTYGSPNTSITKYGLVRTLNIGLATITAVDSNGNKANCNINVVEDIGKISFDITEVNLKKGETVRYNPFISPTPNNYIKLTNWTSSNSSVATVDSTGNVTANSVGKTTISVSSESGFTTSYTLNVISPATYMYFEEPNITLVKGQSKKLNLIVKPDDCTDTVTYKSSDSDLSVDSNGVITASEYYTGTYTITAESSSGATAACQVKVINPPVIATGLELNYTEKTMLVGEVLILKGTFTPADATDKTLTWKSSNENVATVSQNGSVTAKSGGKVTITATSSNGIVAGCVISIIDPASDKQFTLTAQSRTAAVGSYVDIPLIVGKASLSYLSAEFTYDTTKLQFFSVCDVAFDNFKSSMAKEGKIRLVCSDDTAVEPGKVATLRFKVLAQDPCETDVKITSITGNDAELNDIVLTTVDSSINLVIPSYGDINLDGNVDVTDYALVILASVGEFEMTDEQFVNADVNGDGAVDLFDAFAIDKYINGIAPLPKARKS